MAAISNSLVIELLSEILVYVRELCQRTVSILTL